MRVVLSVLCLHFCLVSGAQNLALSTAQKANKNFENYSYSEALRYYQLMLEDSDDPFILERIALCYHKLNQPSRSEGWLKKAINALDSPDVSLYLYLAEALTSNERYDEAIQWYNTYAQKHPTASDLVKSRIAGIKQKDQILLDKKRYSVEEVKFNSPYSDFSPTYYKNGLAFVSSRNVNQWVQNSYNWDETSYLDIFIVDSAGNISQNGLQQVNTKYHDGPLEFYNNNTRIVFTRNSYSSKNKNGVTKLQMYFGTWSEKENGFVNIKPFPFNDLKYSFGHPTINEEGTVLYFISDMPGGNGGTDIYITIKESDQWSKPVNLGPKINTAGNEVFPYLVHDNLLVFSSNGHQGLGGLDLFKVAVDGSVVKGEIENLKAPFNSPKDDFGLIATTDFTSGYFSSNRKEELNDDIFRFSYQKPNMIMLNGKVLSQKDSSSLNESMILVLSEAGELRISEESLPSGEFSFEIPWGENLKIVAAKDNYTLVDTITIDGLTEENELSAELYMAKIPKTIGIQALDKATSEKLESPILMLTNEDKDQLIPNPGTSKYIFEPGKPYFLTIAKEGYYTTKDTILLTENEIEALENYQVSLKKIVVGESIRLDNIYYDVNSANLRTESEMELEKVVEFMTDNPGIKIELSSHTDSRGSALYNQSLSQRRAESAANYLVGRGIDEQRIIPRGYGESQLLNRCSDGVKCSGKEHQMNRRTEIKILSDH